MYLVHSKFYGFREVIYINTAQRSEIIRLYNQEMSQARILNLFHQSTEMYKNDNYQACIALINDCLLLQPSSPTLYSNRAIANFHLSNINQAQTDLEHSIQIDYLNHVAYFNLFSLHLTNANHEASFSNLCFSLSSLCTKVANKEKDLALAEKAIYYSYNNKQALSLAGLCYLEKGKLDFAFKYLSQALRLQSDGSRKKKMQKTIRWLSQQIKEEHAKFQQNFVSGDKFKLQTKINCPNREQFEYTTNQMLEEFNQLYSRLLKMSEQQVKLMSQGLAQDFETSSLKEASENSSLMKEDKNTNKLTAYSSNVAHELQTNKESSEAHFSVSSLKNQQSQQTSQINSHSQQQHMKSCKQSRKKDQKQMLINFKLYYAQILPTQEKKCNHFYAVLKYNEDKNGISITSCQREQSDFIQWNEKSQSFQLSRNASNLEIKIFDKNVFRFEDELLGVGWLQVGQLGLANVPLLDRSHRHIANIVVGVQLCRQ